MRKIQSIARKKNPTHVTNKKKTQGATIEHAFYGRYINCTRSRSLRKIGVAKHKYAYIVGIYRIKEKEKKKRGKA